jgi:hypothetical protein
MSVQCLQPVSFLSSSLVSFLMSPADMWVLESFKSLPVLRLHLVILSSKPSCIQKEQHTAFWTSALETNSLHSVQSYQMSESLI